MKLPRLGTPLSSDDIALLGALAQSCRRSIIEMVAQAQSGHPGGSLSMIDILTVLYGFIASQTGDPVVVSNGHISPAVYAILAELGIIPKERVIATFRRPDDIYEGHVNRHVAGVPYSTGPLGIGGSVGASFALASHLRKKQETTYVLMGDGEQQEGQAYEMMNFAVKYRLSNLVVLIDDNGLQLSAAISAVMPMNLAGHYRAAGWEVMEIDGHDYADIWDALGRAKALQLNTANSNEARPVCILAKTIMGKGVSYMEEAARAGRSSWHGSPPNKELAAQALTELTVTDDQRARIAAFVGDPKINFKKHITSPPFAKHGSAVRGIQTGTPRTYTPDVHTDCRSAYGAALVDLATLNPSVIAMTADLSGSVKTDGVQKAFPERHIECGISEQHMVSAAGGMSLHGLVPFCSTFGAFMTSRARDQARVNDINETNVKMVATHCGLSVGEDGPTHQAIDDISSFLGFFHTDIFEPADPNQCDRVIRAIVHAYGNAYVRMGRSKLPIITREDGTPFFGGDYVFKPGVADVIRTGSDITVLASGPMVATALEARTAVADCSSVEVIAISSHKPFDHKTVLKSARKTGRVITIEDHNADTGMGAVTRMCLLDAGICVPFAAMGVKAYQLSGTAQELYERAGLSTAHLVRQIETLMKLLHA